MEEEIFPNKVGLADLEDEDFVVGTVYDDLAGKVLKWEEVIEARLSEIDALIKVGVVSERWYHWYSA